MPFTPYHLGPGTLLKGVLQDRFSLIIFGWAQVMMDLQPLVTLMRGSGQLHGWTHTSLGASIVGCAAVLTGRPLAAWLLRRAAIAQLASPRIGWGVVWSSALIGTFSHITLDGIMHRDMQPFQPFTSVNPLLRVVPVELLHQGCLALGIVGALIFVGVQARCTTEPPAPANDHHPPADPQD